MQLFNLTVDENDKRLMLGDEIKPEQFKNISKGKNQKGKEKDIEEIIVANPSLLNYSESDFGSNDLLIISRQLTSKTKKRADLVALDKSGFLITIEIKRDAQDESNRAECMEFQSIRYAATHRTLDVEGVINIYAEYLKQLKPDSPEIDFRRQAVDGICKHLSDTEDDKVSEENLSDYIDPTERQKIFLVAADFAPDCLSACAWLREHNIDIYCFKLQPYKINGKYVLNQERLIPPVALDDFYIGTKEAKAKEKLEQGTRNPSIKPSKLFWGNEEYPCSAWSQVFVKCVELAIKNGFKIDQLPCPHTFEESEASNYFRAEKLVVNDKVFYINKNASKESIVKWISDIIKELHQADLSVSVDLRDGTTETFNA